MADRKWSDYLSESGLARRNMGGDALLELPEEDWSWKTLGLANQQKYRAQRAVLLELYAYFLQEPDNIHSGVNVQKLWTLDSMEMAQIILTWLDTEKTRRINEMVNLAIGHVSPTFPTSPTVKAEQKPATRPGPYSSHLQDNTDRLKMQRFKETREAVPIFSRVYETSKVTAWVKAISAVFKNKYAAFWFEDTQDEIDFVLGKTDAACQEWLNGLPPATSYSELIETIRAAHWPSSDKEDARDALAKLQLSSYGLNREAIYQFNQDFQALLPRCEFTDNLSLRDVWKNGVGKKMWTELLKYETISKDKSYDISIYYEFSQTKWAGGWRPPKDMNLPRKEEKKDDKKGDNAKTQEKSLVATPLHKLTARLNSIKSKNTWKAVIKQILREPTQLPSAPNQLLNKFNEEQKKRYLNKECFFCGEGGHYSNSCPKKGTVQKVTAVEEPDSRYDLECLPPSNPLPLVAPMTGKGTTMASTLISTLNKLSCDLPLLPSHITGLLLEETPTEPVKSSRLAYQRVMAQMAMDLNEPIMGPTFNTRWKEYMAAAKEKATTARLSTVVSQALRSSQPQAPPSVEPGSIIPLLSPDDDRACIPGIINDQEWEILCDSGASGQFMGKEASRRLELHPKPISSASIGINYAKNEVTERATEYVTARIQLGTYWKDINFILADIGTSVILGTPWLKTLDFHLDLENHKMTFLDRLTGRHHQVPTAGAETTTGPVNFNPSKASKGMPRITHQELLRHKRSAQIWHVSLAQTSYKTPSTPQLELDKVAANYVSAFPSVFAEMSGLPPSRPEDMEILVDPDKPIPKSRPLRNHTAAELEILRERIKELLERGFIKPSTSPYGASILFVKKSDGGLRLCVDYRGLNDNTVKNRAPLPSIAEMRNRLAGSAYFTKLDLKDGYHNIRIRREDIHKTAFKCRYGHFEYTVIPFGLANAPAVFSNMMNRVLASVLDICVISYLDDILIYSATADQHDKDVKTVLGLLADEKLFLKASKCSFHKDEVVFCGHHVGRKGIRPTEDKVKAMAVRPRIRTVKDIQSYLGSVVWFQDFIPDYAAITEPLTRLLAKGVPFSWGVEQEDAITILIHLITTAPVLKYFDPTLDTYVYSDASEFAIGGWVGQKHADGIHPVAFWSRKLTPSERKYHVYEKELLALIAIIEKQSHLLRGVRFTCNTDHKSLESLQSQPKLSGRQARWILQLQEYDCAIQYHPGKKNTVADWLTRNPEMESHCTECTARLGKMSLSLPESTLLEEISTSYSTDRLALQLESWKLNTPGMSPDERRFASLFTKIGNLWYRQEASRKDHSFTTRLYVPENPVIRTNLLNRYHDLPSAGHQGAKRTGDRLAAHYWWPGLREAVNRYTRSCESCQRHKEVNHSKYGFLHPLPIPEDRCQQLSIDWFFLPTSKEGFDSVMVIIDRLTKLLALVPCKKTDSAEDSAKQFLKSWYSTGKGLPKTISSDRDSKFTSLFWAEVGRALGIEQRLATARHQSANGQAEVQVRIVKKVLRKFANYSQDNWADVLPLVEFSLNNSVSNSTGYSPFYLFNGFEPRVFPDELLVKDSGNGSSKSAHFLLKNIGIALEKAREAISAAQADMLLSYNRRHTRPPPIAVGSSVWVNGEGISWPANEKRPNALQAPWLGPFAVSSGLDDQDNVVLELPPSLARVDPKFHVSKLEPFVPNDPVEFPGRSQEPGEVVVNADGDYEAELEAIVDSRWHRGKLQVLCKYLGFPLEEAEWHDYSADDGSWDTDRALVVQYFANNPLRPPPSPIRRGPKKGLAGKDRSPPVARAISPPRPSHDPGSSHLSNPPLRRSTRLRGIIGS